MKRTALVAASILFVSAMIGLLLIAGEISLRAIDGYKLLAWTLVRTGSPAQTFAPGKTVQEYAEKFRWRME